MPSTDRSGLSAAIGLALVVGLLLVGGTLAVSGGGILSSGGRLGVEAAASLLPEAPADEAPVDEGPGEVSPPEGTEPSSPETAAAGGDVGLAFEYTCENGAIKDLGGSRWFLSQFRAGQRVAEDETFERITWEMSKRGKAKSGTTISMEWTTPREARDAYGVELVSGQRALVVTFDGPVDITAGQGVDELSLEPEGVDRVRTIEMFEGEDGKVRTVVGIRGESCARMSSLGWTKKAEARNARIYLDVEKL
jgi:hypothetical protein